MGRPGLLLYFDLIPALDKLPVDCVGKLLLSALHYAESGQEPSFDEPTLEFAWAFIRPSIDRDGAAYETKRERGEWLTYCRQCKRDGTEALGFEDWQRVSNDTLQIETASLPSTSTTHLQHNINPESTTDYIRADKPPKHIRFVPPSLSEIRDYCQERRNNVDPEKFFDFYESKGWLVGKNKMKDWRAAVRNWERGENHGAISSSTVDHGQAEGRWGKLQSVQLD